MPRLILAILVAGILMAGCMSDAEYAAREQKRRQALDSAYPKGMARADAIAKEHLGRPRHFTLPDENLADWLAGDDYIRWCIGDCVVRGDPPVASVDVFPTPSGIMGLGALAVLYDADDRVVRAYWRHVD